MKHALFLLSIIVTISSSPVAAAPVLGVGYKNDSFYAAIGNLDLSSGNLIFASASSPYLVDSQLQLCINAKIVGDNLVTMYALQTYDPATYFYGFNILNEAGTMVSKNFSRRGNVENYLIVAWSHYPSTTFLASIGWPANVNGENCNELFCSHRQKGRMCENYESDCYHQQDENIAEISLVNYKTGEIKLLTKVPGESFLECAAIVDNNWFHYVWLDDAGTIYTGSIDLLNPKLFLQVAIPQEYGLILNLAVHGGVLVASTELGHVLTIDQKIGKVAALGKLDISKYQVTLGASTIIGENLYTLQGGQGGQGNLLATFNGANYSASYLPLDSGEYKVSLANF
jgi:hypothetical protein